MAMDEQSETINHAVAKSKRFQDLDKRSRRNHTYSSARSREPKYGRFKESDPWGDGRVAEGARLESVFRGNSNVGSNPTLSPLSSLPLT